MNLLSKAKKRSESKIVTACCDYLAIKRRFFWRQNNTPIFDATANRFRAMPKHSRKGIPDIFVIVHSGIVSIGSPWDKHSQTLHPKIYALEVKTEVGRQSHDQKSFEKDWVEYGGVYAIIRSVDDLMKLGL